MLSIPFFLFVLSVSFAAKQKFYDLNKAEELFEKFIIEYNRHYADQKERDVRYSAFKQRLASINELNLKSNGAVHGITKFMDITPEESRMLGGITVDDLGKRSLPNGTYVTEKEVLKQWRQAPSRLDWRDHNYVTRVKNQGECSSCWAFGAIGTLEGQYAKVHKQLLEFSEQQLVDCTNGCNTSWVYKAYEYLMDAGGAELESKYPYTAHPNTCRKGPFRAKFKIVRYNSYTNNSEESLKQTLYNVGPMAVMMRYDTLLTYKGANSAIIEYCKDDSKPLHVVLLIGFGSDCSGDYWIFKNSWGTDWGQQGFFKLRRGVNACGMLNYEIVAPVII